MVTRLQSDLCTSTAFIPCATAQSLHLSGITITRLPHSLSPKSLTRCHTGYWVSPISCQSIFATPSCVHNIKAKLTIRVMCILSIQFSISAPYDTLHTRCNICRNSITLLCIVSFLTHCQQASGGDMVRAEFFHFSAITHMGSACVDRSHGRIIVEGRETVFAR